MKTAVSFIFNSTAKICEELPDSVVREFSIEKYKNHSVSDEVSETID